MWCRMDLVHTNSNDFVATVHQMTFLVKKMSHTQTLGPNLFEIENFADSHVPSLQNGLPRHCKVCSRLAPVHPKTLSGGDWRRPRSQTSTQGGNGDGREMGGRICKDQSQSNCQWNQVERYKSALHHCKWYSSGSKWGLSSFNNYPSLELL